VTARALFTRLVLVLGGVVLAEAALRAGLALAGHPYDAAAARQSARDLVPSGMQLASSDEPRGEELFLHPFQGYESDQELARTRSLLHYMEARDPSAQAPYTILIVGGSVAMFFGARVNGGTESLEAVLRQDARFAGKEIVFVGQGRSAFKQPQQLFLTASLFQRGFRPDAVIDIDGFNEVALGLHNLDFGADPLFPAFQFWGPLVAGRGSDVAGIELASAVLEQQREHLTLVRWSERLGLFHSAISGLCVRELARSRRSAWELALRAYLQHEAADLDPRLLGRLEPPPDADAALTAIVDHWVESSRSLHALCAERGIRYLHVLQPTLLDEGSKPLTDVERSHLDVPESVARGVRLGYPRLREAGERLRELGVPFVDASDVFLHEEQTIYFDACHFRRPGCALLGERIGRAFLALGDVPEPRER